MDEPYLRINTSTPQEIWSHSCSPSTDRLSVVYLLRSHRCRVEPVRSLTDDRDTPGTLPRKTSYSRRFLT